MADPTGSDHLPQATVVPPKRTRISVIWIIPILAAVVAIGIAIQRILSEGPTIAVVFTAAEGIEAGKTFIKYKDVNIGQVKTVRLTGDYKKVEVTAKIAKHAAGLMVDDAKFWVVSPHIGLTGISGLSTLLSGNYIGFEPGTTQQSADNFIGLDVPPVVAGELGRHFLLNSSDLGSLSVGSPVYYRRLPVGEVTGYDLQPDGKSVQIKVFVKAPHDKYVATGTRFWNASGVDVSVGTDGVNVRTESLIALLAGGVAFDVPPFLVAQGAPAAPDTAFTLYSDRSVAMKAPDPIAKRYVLIFNESVRGLSVGAPVTLMGLPAGEVASVGLAIDTVKSDIRPRVKIVFYPERILGYEGSNAEAKNIAAVLMDEQKRHAFMRRMVERGMRAQLKSGSLITGQLYVAIDYHPDAPKAKLDFAQAEPEMPTVPSDLANLEAKVSSIVDKIDGMPLEAIGKDIKKDLEDLDQTLISAKKIISHADEQLMPGLKADIQDLHGALVAVERAMNNANASYLEPNAPTQEELRNALYEFTRAARSLRVLSDELERQPSSLIRGKVEPSGGK